MPSRPRPTLLLVAVLVAVLTAGCKSRRPQMAPVEGPGTTIHFHTEQSDLSDAEPATEEDLLDDNRVLARVNGEIITVRSIKAEYRAALEARGPMTGAELGSLIDGWTLDEVRKRLELSAARREKIKVPKKRFEEVIEAAEAEAKKRGTTLDEDLRARGEPRWEWEEDLRQRLTGQQFVGMLSGAAVPSGPSMRALVDPWPRPADVRSRYDRTREGYRVSGAATVDAIFVRWATYLTEGGSRGEAIAAARARAEEARDRAERGESFEALRAELGVRPVLEAPIVKGSRGDAIERFAFRAAVGEVSPLIPTAGSNFFVLKLIERRPEGVLPFEDVRASIEEDMQSLRVRLASLTILSRLLREAVISPPRVRMMFEQAVRQDLAMVLMSLSL